MNATSEQRGHVRIQIAQAGTLVARAAGPGYVRAAPLRVSELP